MTKARDLANSAAAFASVSATELGFVDGVTSAIQTQMDAKAPSSTAATLSGTQTLTNKTIDTASNTITGAVTLTGTQTLTNKTLTSPVIASVINNTLTSTTGDIIYASAANTPARLGIGTTGQVLNVASGIPAWTTASAGGMTLITTTTWNNSVGTYTYSSLGSYKQIVFVGQNLKHSSAAASSEWNIRFNGSTANNYGQSIIQMNGTAYSGTSNANQTSKIILSVPAGSTLGASGGGANFDGDFMLTLPDYGSAQFKCVFWSGGSCQDGTRCMSVGTGHFSDITAITSVTLFMTSGNFESGTMRVYGVS